MEFVATLRWGTDRLTVEVDHTDDLGGLTKEQLCQAIEKAAANFFTANDQYPLFIKRQKDGTLKYPAIYTPVLFVEALEALFSRSLSEQIPLKPQADPDSPRAHDCFLAEASG